MSIDILDPFMTFFREHRDHNGCDARKEAEMLYQRQGAIEDMLEGKEHPDTVLDLLEEQGIDAANYADQVHQQVTAIIDCGIVYTSNDAGLLLPSGVLL